MSIEVRAEGLAELLEENNKRLAEANRASRTTNVLLMANALGLDASEPVARAKVLRHLDLLESSVSRDE